MAHPTSRRSVLAAAVSAPLIAALAACSSDDSSSKTSDTPSSGTGKNGGSVAVLYAGSLVHLMEKQIFPAFTKKTSTTVDGVGGGSNGLAKQIQSKARKADVFVSASPAADKQLMGSENGDWVSWYATFATAPLVLGYSEKSRFAADVTSKSWQDVLAMPGIKIGTTDPKTDPKGKLAHQALSDEGKKHPALAKLADDTSIQRSEESMVGQLQAGQLDVGFFYASEAKAAGIPTVPLTGTDLKATYTVTIPKGAPNEKGAIAFIQYLLGDESKKTLQDDGFTLAKSVKVTGAGVPSGLSTLLKSA